MSIETRDQEEAAGVEAAPPPVAGAPEGAADLPETVIRAEPGWKAFDLRELWRYRELLFFLAWRDVKVRYKQTLLGVAWAVLQPVLMMVVFTMFLGNIVGVRSGGHPYPLFVYTGLLPWTFFATAVSNAGASVVGSERLITKVYFPRLIVPFAAVGSALVDFLIALGLLGVLMAGYAIADHDIRLTWGLLLIPPLIALTTLAAFGVGSLLAALNVAYRDVRYVIPFLVQLWMFATPSIYMDTRPPAPPPAEAPSATDAAGDSAPAAPAAGAATGALANANPMTGLVAFFRAAALGDDPLPWGQLGVSAALILALFVGGCFYFRRVEDSFADII